ncbi:MAG: UvrD-helicase domain-containing protein, partial [Tepidanaerobacteraceae bacterium]
MKLIYSGPVGSGKTAALINKYLELVEEGIRSDRILVLTRSTLDVSRWRRELKAPALGKLNVHTYFGFVQEQLTSYWPMVEDRLPGRLRFSLPVFMTVEASHYLMMQLVEEKLDQGGFRDVRSTSDAISIQLIDNLNLAAVSKIPLEKAFVRLRLLGAVGGAEKQAAFRDAIELMKRFRENCLQNRSIDYSLMVELYNDILFSDERYLARLHDSYHYLIVDDIDETVPVAQDL